MEKPEPDRWKKIEKQSNSYAKYSALAFQMLGTIVGFTYLGYRIDSWQQSKIPVWTLILSLGSIAASLYMFIKGSTND
jgi:hypothetical protein